MTAPSLSSPHHLLVGGLVYVAVSVAWLGIAVGAAGAPPWVLVPGLALVLIVGGVAALSLRGALKQAPFPSASAEVGKGIGILFALEGAAIGTGAGVLAALERPEAITAWTALCVGLHFFPLARLLGIARDHLLGALMVGGTAAAFTVLPTQAAPPVIAVAMALLLALAAVGRVVDARRLPAAGRE